MSSPATELKILVVDDDPSTSKKIDALVSGHPVRIEFADTPNAISRLFGSDQIHLAIIHLHETSRGLLEPLADQARSQNVHIPVIALLGEDPDSALEAAARSVEGLGLMTDERSLKGLLERTIAWLLDLQAARAALSQLEDIEARYTLLLESSSEAIAYLHEGLHIYANPTYLRQFGYDDFADVEGLSILDLLSTDDSGIDLKKLLRSLSRGKLPTEAMSASAHRSDGTTFEARVHFSPARYAGEQCTQMKVREVIESDESLLKEELEKLRTRDQLTGLLNRQSFLERLQNELHGDDEGGPMAVVLVSLDDHGGLQEKLGAGATDTLIRQTAELFKKITDDTLLPSRLRDHTLALRSRVKERREAERLARNIVEAYSGHILEVRDKSLTVTASVGLAIGGSQTASVDELISQAETALAEAARTGGDSYVRFRPRTDAVDSADEEQWAERLRHALNNDDLRLVKLPITSMEDDDLLIQEVEARLRIEDSDEVLLPQSYLPAAIKIGLCADLDRSLVTKLIGQVAESDPESGEYWLLPLCSASLIDGEFVDWLQERVDSGKLPAKRLILGFREIEVRESLRDVQKFIRRFATRGCQFALCDLALGVKLDPLLKNIDVHYLKLQPEAIAALGGQEKARADLEGIVRSAESRSIRVISPRVEKTSDLAMLWQFGITLVQDDFVREEA